MANWRALRKELLEDPLSIGYVGMTDSEAANSLNTDIPVPVPSVTAGALYEAIDAAEYNGLNNSDKAIVDRILSLGDNIDATPGSRARTEIVGVFGVGTTTRANLANLVDKTTTRALQVFGEPVNASIVNRARS